MSDETTLTVPSGSFYNTTVGCTELMHTATSGNIDSLVGGGELITVRGIADLNHVHVVRALAHAMLTNESHHEHKKEIVLSLYSKHPRVDMILDAKVEIIDLDIDDVSRRDLRGVVSLGLEKANISEGILSYINVYNTSDVVVTGVIIDSGILHCDIDEKVIIDFIERKNICMVNYLPMRETSLTNNKYTFNNPFVECADSVITVDPATTSSSDEMVPIHISKYDGITVDIKTNLAISSDYVSAVEVDA